MSFVSLIFLRRLGTRLPAGSHYGHPTPYALASFGKLNVAKKCDRSQNVALPQKIANSVTAKECHRKVLQSPLIYFSKTKDSLQDTSDASNEPPKRSDKPSEQVLESIAEKLLYYLSHFFTHRFDYNLFRADLVFENRINGKTTVGALSYIQQQNMLKIYGHLRFAFVKFNCINYSTHVEDGVVKIRWQMSGLGMLRLAIFYFPKKLYKMENMVKEAKVFTEGISYYYVDGEGKIYRHVMDNREEDKGDKVVVNIGERILEKVQKLSPKTPDSAPV